MKLEIECLECGCNEFTEMGEYKSRKQVETESRKIYKQY